MAVRSGHYRTGTCVCFAVTPIAMAVWDAVAVIMHHTTYIMHTNRHV